MMRRRLGSTSGRRAAGRARALGRDEVLTPMTRAIATRAARIRPRLSPLQFLVKYRVPTFLAQWRSFGAQSGIERFMNSSNIGTVKAVSPC